MLLMHTCYCVQLPYDPYAACNPSLCLCLCIRLTFITHTAASLVHMHTSASSHLCEAAEKPAYIPVECLRPLLPCFEQSSTTRMCSTQPSLPAQSLWHMHAHVCHPFANVAGTSKQACLGLRSTPALSSVPKPTSYTPYRARQPGPATSGHSYKQPVMLPLAVALFDKSYP